jgi:hypothetical protein
MEIKHPTSSAGRIKRENTHGLSLEHSIILRTFIWLLPISIIIAFFVDLGWAAAWDDVTNLIYGSSPPEPIIENIFFKLGIVMLIIGGIYVPLVSALKIVKTGTILSKTIKVIGLTLFGYILIIVLSIGWGVLGSSDSILTTLEKACADKTYLFCHERFELWQL